MSIKKFLAGMVISASILAFPSITTITGVSVDITGVCEKTVYAETVKDWVYEVDGNEVTIKGYFGDSTVVNIPSTIDGKKVTYIDSETFNENDNITTINIPETVEGISSSFLQRNYYVKNINVDENNPSLMSLENVFYSKIDKSLVLCLPNIRGTFVIPENVTYIENGAFRYCNGINAIVIPDSMEIVNTLGVPTVDSHFTEYKVNESNTKYAVKDGVLYSKDYKTLYACPTGLSGNYSVENGTKILYKLCFSSCYKLNKISLPSTATTIGYRSFERCLSLKEITIPDSVVNFDNIL